MHGIFFNPPIEDNWLGHIVAEIYKDKIYEPYLIGKKDLIILDIGANLGITSYYFSKFAKQVYALEPAFEHFDVLAHMLTFNQLTNIKPIRKAIFTENKKFPLFHNKNKTMYSLHQNVADGLSPNEMVEAITLDQLFKDENIDHVDLMKLDVEGSEVEILSSLSFHEVANKIDVIIGEQHSWSGRHPNQLREALKSNGFSYETLANDANLFVAKR